MSKAELAKRRFAREKTRTLMKCLQEIEARMVADENQLQTAPMLSQLRAIQRRVAFLDGHATSSNLRSLTIRMGQMETNIKTIHDFVVQEMGIIRRAVIASRPEPHI